MASRAEFEQVVAQAPKKQLDTMYQESSAAVAANGGETLYFFASPNTIAKISSLIINIPAITGATTGSQVIYVQYVGSIGSIMACASDYNVDINFDVSQWTSGTIPTPSDVVAQTFLSQSIMFDETIGLQFQYINNTDKPTNTTRKYYANIIKESVTR